jgi:hypothetical protein
VRCYLPIHDHRDEDECPMLCIDCGEPCHYDDATGQYRHNSTTHSCWLHVAGAGCIHHPLRVRWSLTLGAFVWQDDGSELTADEAELLGLDGTGRTMAAWATVAAASPRVADAIDRVALEWGPALERLEAGAPAELDRPYTARTAVFG